MSALKMQAEVLSEMGVRENNKDAAFASPRLVAVADGVGGAAVGEIADGRKGETGRATSVTCR